MSKKAIFFLGGGGGGAEGCIMEMPQLKRLSKNNANCFLLQKAYLPIFYS